MIITFKDPNLRIHGKLHKRDPYYFRVHYGKQRMVYITKEYTDRPTEKQKASRNTFTELRREVARQLHDPTLKARWQAKFQADPQGYKFLHTYVYAQLKAGVTVLVETPFTRVSPPRPNRPSSPRRLSSPSSPSSPRRLILSHPIENSPQKTYAKDISTPYAGSDSPILILYNHTILPLFLPAHIPKTNHLQI